MWPVEQVGGIGCLVPRSGPNLALFELCGAMDGESCEVYTCKIPTMLALESLLNPAEGPI